MRMSKQFQTISGGYSGKLEDMRSFARWSSKPRAFSFYLPSPRSPELGGFSITHKAGAGEQRRMAAGLRGLYPERLSRYPLARREERFPDPNHGSSRGHSRGTRKTGYEPDDYSRRVSSPILFHCDPVSRIRLVPRVQDQSMSCRALPLPHPSPAPAAGLNVCRLFSQHLGPGSSRSSGLLIFAVDETPPRAVRSRLDPISTAVYPPRMVPSPAFECSLASFPRGKSRHSGTRRHCALYRLPGRGVNFLFNP